MKDIPSRADQGTSTREALPYDEVAAVVAVTPDAIIVESPSGTIEAWNAGAERMLGYSARESIGKRSERLLGKDAMRDMGDARAALTRGEAAASCETLWRGRDGTRIPVSITLAPARDADQRLTHVTLIARDLRAQRAAERRIARMTRDYAILRAINAAIVRIRDRIELFEEACRVAVTHGGFRMAWIGGVGTSKHDPIVALAHAGHEQGFLKRVHVMLDRDTPGGRGVVAPAIAGNRTAVENDIAAALRLGDVRDECLARGYRAAAALPLRSGGAPQGALVLYASEPGYFTVEEIRLLEEFAADIALGMAFIAKSEQAEFLAYHDPLTGLVNRARFLERIARHTENIAGGERFAIALIDVVRFHSVNDTYGSAAGDEVLRTLARRLRAACPAGEPPARIGADTFGVLLPGARNVAPAVEHIERLMAQSIGAPIAVAGSELRLAARAGVALAPLHGYDAATLFTHAEAAREIAKSSPVPLVVYAPDMNIALSGARTTENRLRHGVETRQFVVHYQPKVDSATDAIVGAEALLRWNDPEGGLTSTQHFVALLEETGLIVDAGRFVLSRVVEDLARWRAQGLVPPRIAVNVSTVQLRGEGFFREFTAFVKEAGGAHAGLDLEITESALLADLPETIDRLKELRALGVDIAIDDFGTGYSSLSYLARLPVSTLKIDRSFLLEMPDAAGGEAIVSTIISLAHALRFKVVAEGVETIEQAQLLRRLGCDQMQGFLFHGAMTRERFEALLPRATHTATL